VARSGSGDTSGPDDEDQEKQLTEDAQIDDPKHVFNSAEMSQKALESAKYLGSK